MTETIRDHSGIELQVSEGRVPDEITLLVHDSHEPIIAVEMSLDKAGIDWLIERLQKMYPDG